MKSHACSLLLAALLFGGCGGQRGAPEPVGDLSELAGDGVLDEALALPHLLDELELAPELDEALRQAEAVRENQPGPVGQIAEEKYGRWIRSAEVRLDLELARVRARCLQHVVEQLKQCEQQYLDRVGNGALYRGENAARQLAVFRRLRQRFDGDLAVAVRRAEDLGEQLACLEREKPAAGWLAVVAAPFDQPDARTAEADPDSRMRSESPPPKAVEEDKS